MICFSFVTACGHSFHPDCLGINHHFEFHSRCPECKKYLYVIDMYVDILRDSYEYDYEEKKKVPGAVLDTSGSNSYSSDVLIEKFFEKKEHFLDFKWDIEDVLRLTGQFDLAKIIWKNKLAESKKAHKLKMKILI